MNAVLDPRYNRFDELVAQDVRGAVCDNDAAWLREPQNVERWYDALNALDRSLGAQLTAKRAQIEAWEAQGEEAFLEERAVAQEWRARTLRFKGGVQNRLAEARRLRKNTQTIGFNEILMRERARAVREVLRLRTLILEHRDHECGSRCDEECIADDELWAVLDTEPEL